MFFADLASLHADDIPRIADIAEKAEEDLTLQVAEAANAQVPPFQTNVDALSTIACDSRV